MPHLFVNRERLLSPFQIRPRPKRDFAWANVNELAYLAGSGLFIVGSLFFFPRFGSQLYVGVVICLVGSLLYIAVTAQDLLEAIQYRILRARRGRELPPLQLTAAIGYIAGSSLHVGSDFIYLFEPALIVPSAWLALVGSVLFVLAATCNVVDVVNAPSRSILQLTNLTAVSFVVGSVIFSIASVPGLWREWNATDRDDLLAFLAALYVIGSVIFLVGGLFNYRRAWLVHQTLPARAAARTEAEAPVPP